MSLSLTEITDRYVDAINGSMHYTREHAQIIFILAAVTTPLFYFFDQTFDATYDTWWFRVIGTLACLLPAYTLYRKGSEFAFATTAILAATALLMWMFPAMLMANAASTPIGGSMHYAWICMYLISMFLYVQFISNFLLSFTGWALGFIAATLCVFLVDEPNWDSVVSSYVKPFSIYLTVIVFANLLNRHIEAVERDKTEAAKAIGGNIAHELRTPLTGITSRATALDRFLPEVTAGYEKALSEGLIQQPLTKRQLDLIKESAGDIRAEANYSNSVISMLLLNTSEDLLRGVSFDEFTASSALVEALERYPFPNNTERCMVSIASAECDEIIRAPQLLVVHVLFNLIKNALSHCQRENKGSVELSAYRSDDGVCLMVRDTGPGIPPDVLPKIYDRFFTTSPTGRGSGIGLNFCKSVMTELGGTIDCQSVVGAYTEFRVVFPFATDGEK